MTIEELKAALAEGKIIQMNCGSERYPEWLDMPTVPKFTNPMSCYRIKHDVESERIKAYNDWKKSDAGIAELQNPGTNDN